MVHRWRSKVRTETSECQNEQRGSRVWAPDISCEDLYTPGKGEKQRKRIPCADETEQTKVDVSDVAARAGITSGHLRIAKLRPQIEGRTSEVQNRQ